VSSTPCPDEHRRFEALLLAMMRVLRDPHAAERIADQRETFFAECGVSGADLEQLLAANPKRILVYRKLVRRGLAAAIRKQIPRSAARLGARFEAYVDRFIEEEAPRSPYLRLAIAEFLTWARTRWNDDNDVPDYIGDLAQHEHSYFDISAAEAHEQRGPVLPELELERPTRFDASTRLYRYAYAVHRLSDDLASTDEPAREPTALLAYRDAEHEVHYLELTPLAASILERLLAGEELGAAITTACAALGQPLAAPVLESTAALLTKLRERGALLGAEP